MIDDLRVMRSLLSQVDAEKDAAMEYKQTSSRSCRALSQARIRAALVSSFGGPRGDPVQGTRTPQMGTASEGAHSRPLTPFTAAASTGGSALHRLPLVREACENPYDTLRATCCHFI